jgi:hypothetical protein
LSDYQVQVNQLVSTARGKSDGDVALLEEAARLADLHGDGSLGFRVRMRLINAANWSGNHELVLVAFTWCLAQMDRDEELRRTSERSVLWYYKWVVDSLCDYSQVSKPQIEFSFADMTERYVRAGYGSGPLHKCRAYAAIRLGDMDAHRLARKLWMESPRDGISDCAACQTDSAVEFDLEAGDFTSAMNTAEPVLQGRQRCTEVPCLTVGRLLLPMLKLGLTDLAETLHRGHIRQTLSSRDFLATIGPHVAYLSLTGKTGAALKLFETGVAWLAVTRRTWERLTFVENAVVLFDRLAREGNEPIQIQIPPLMPLHRSDDIYRPTDVATALEEMRQQFADEFNRRNQNQFMEHRHQMFQQLLASLSSAQGS